MAKKLILLLLLIPIVVMILLFAAAQMASNMVEIPPTDIEIIGEKFIYVDMDKNETYTINYAVYPTTAKNKEVSLSTEEVENEPLADFDYTMEDGKVILKPTKAGAVRIVLTTVRGGFKDSIVAYFESTKVQEINASVEKNELMVGESIRINTTFVPTNPSNKIVNYVSSNPNVASVKNGVIQAHRKGMATITVISEENPDITDTVTIIVKNKDAMDLGITDTTVFYGNGSIPISMDTAEAFTVEDLSYQIFDKNGKPVPSSVVSARFKQKGDDFELEYTFHDQTFVGEIVIEITFGTGVTALTKSCRVEKVREIEIAFDHQGSYDMLDGQNVRIPFLVTPEDAAGDFTYEVLLNNDNITASVREDNGTVVISAKKAGVTKVTLVATSKDASNQTKEAHIYVVVQPKNAIVFEAGEIFGIENRLAVGGYEYDANGNLVLSANGDRAIALHFQTSSTRGEGFAENLKWYSSSEKVLINEKGIISFADDGEIFNGEVSFYAVFSYDGIATETAGFTVRCVEDGVNVYSYADLHRATQAELPVVLQNDIVEDFGYIDGVLTYAGEIDTTYDKKYYDNMGEGDKAKVKILVNFRNNVYGNDHVINAHNITYKFKKDADGKYIEDQAGNKTPDLENSLFKGPLSFVEMREEFGTISFKAQDNICFAISKDGVTLSNVRLRGCDIAGDENGNQNLIDLNNVGTTVEVLADNVKIAYSRITNGRTVLRVFGDIDVEKADKKIHLTIQNSVLEGAREFILRAGSNRSVEGNSYLADDNGSKKEYNSKEYYSILSDAEKAAYDEKYINTFVTVENCVFKDAGIFAIGMDTHFSGPLLKNGAENDAAELQFILNILRPFIGGWKDLDRTSYGAKLYFKGEVGLYSWKNIKDVDSTSLIELEGTSNYYDLIKLNIQEMLNLATDETKFPENKDIVTLRGEEKYVHAGIVFFGGSKNYSIFDSEGNMAGELGRYKISLGDVGKDYLNAAAGEEDFYFFLYNNGSSFTPEVQAEKLASGEAYDCIYRK